MKILVTGAMGFIGQLLVKQEKLDCRCVVRSGKKHHFKDVFIIDDLNSHTVWQGAFEGIDVVVHLAGLAHSSEYHAKAYDEVNNKGTLKLAKEAAKAGVKRFIFVSTALVNGGKTLGKPFKESDEAHPVNDYANSKYQAELGLKKISQETQMELVIIRPSLVYGPNVKANFLALVNLVKKLPVLPFGLAKNARSFISVYNLIDFIVLCTTHKKARGETFLISDNEIVTTKMLTNRMTKAFGKKVLQLPIPVCCFKALGFLLGKKRQVDQLFGDFMIDCSKAQDLLGWRPKVTMEQTLLALTKEINNDG